MQESPSLLSSRDTEKIRLNKNVTHSFLVSSF